MPDIDIVFNFVIHLNPALLLLIASHLAQWVARAWQMIPDSAARPDGAHRQEAARRCSTSARPFAKAKTWPRRHASDKGKFCKPCPASVHADPRRESTTGPASTRLRSRPEPPHVPPGKSQCLGAECEHPPVPIGSTPQNGPGRLWRSRLIRGCGSAGRPLRFEAATRQRRGRFAVPLSQVAAPPLGRRSGRAVGSSSRRRARLRQHRGQQAAPVSGRSLAVLVHMAAPAPCFQVGVVEGVTVLRDGLHVMHLEGEAVAPPAAPLVPHEYLQPNTSPACRPVDLRRPPASHRIVTF